MDDFTEKHFQAWLDRVIIWYDEEKRAELEKSIRDLVKDDPDLLETHSWSEMRFMADC